MGKLSPGLRRGLRQIAILAAEQAPLDVHYPNISLVPWRGEFQTSHRAVFDFMQQEVETLSRGRRTVRRVADGLRTVYQGNLAMELVLCDAATPPGEVTTLTPDMFVFAVYAGTVGYFPR